MTAGAKHSLIGFKQIHLASGLVNPMAGETCHRITGAGVASILSQRMPGPVLVGVATAAERNRVVWKK